MTSDEILQKLRESKTALRAQGVSRAALFGSIARGEAGPASDIDIMVEIAPEANVYYVGIVQFLKELFPVRVDVANRAGSKPLARPSAERDAVYAF